MANRHLFANQTYVRLKMDNSFSRVRHINSAPNANHSSNKAAKTTPILHVECGLWGLPPCLHGRMVLCVCLSFYLLQFSTTPPSNQLISFKVATITTTTESNLTDRRLLVAATHKLNYERLGVGAAEHSIIATYCFYICKQTYNLPAPTRNSRCQIS